MLWYKLLSLEIISCLRNASQMKPIFWISTHISLCRKKKVYQEMLNVAGTGNKLTSTQVTAMNIQREGPASVSHCKSLKCPEKHCKPREWLANVHDESAKAIHSLTSAAVLVKVSSS